nr:protein kinase [Naasia sp. SYSU D00057]
MGSGGHATVYTANDTLLGREVAIKVFTALADDADRLRLQAAEAKLVAGLNHHALTTLFDAGVDVSAPNRPQIYLVMENIPGDDLKERLRRGPLTPLQVTYLAIDLVEALHYVHENGFLHRDIKPANVLLADRDAGIRLRGKLTDFGIATIIGERTLGQTTTGTAAYLSPEQVAGASPSRASDVYALGLVLLEALTGVVEFPGTPHETLVERMRRDPAVPETLPPLLAETLRGMTARDPKKRMTLPAAANRLQRSYVDELVAAGVVGSDASGEAGRAAAARRFNVLEEPAPDAFDSVTRLAKRLLDAPVAAVSIVDADHVWHKSGNGRDVARIDRNETLCTVAVDARGTVAYPDLLAEEHLRAHPVVAGGSGIRAYAAAPLVTEDGYRIGALCVYDWRPRAFSSQQLGDLTDLAALAMREIELRLSGRRAYYGAR